MLFKEMYLKLFNRVTDAIRCLEAGDAAAALALLKQSQAETEEMYINGSSD